MDTKNWMKSKTIWANVIALVLGAVQSHFGWVIPAEVQGALLVLINCILRGLTNQPLDWGLGTDLKSDRGTDLKSVPKVDK